MAKNDDLEKLDNEFHEWKREQELKQAKAEGRKEGRWKTCTLAWSIITMFVGSGSWLCVKFSDAVYAGLHAFWVVALEKLK